MAQKHAMYSEIRMQALPCSIQNFLVSSSGLDKVSPSFTFSWEKNVGLKSIPMFLSFANSTHFAKCFGSNLSLSTYSPSSKIAQQAWRFSFFLPGIRLIAISISCISSFGVLSLLQIYDTIFYTTKKTLLCEKKCPFLQLYTFSCEIIIYFLFSFLFYEPLLPCIRKDRHLKAEAMRQVMMYRLSLAMSSLQLQPHLHIPMHRQKIHPLQM